MFSSRSSTKEESDSRLIHLFGRILFIGLRFLPSCYWQEVALNCFRSCSHSLTQWPLLFFFFKQNIIIIFWLEWFWTKLDKGYTEQNILCMRGVEKGRQNPVSLFFFLFSFFEDLFCLQSQQWRIAFTSNLLLFESPQELLSLLRSQLTTSGTFITIKVNLSETLILF